MSEKSASNFLAECVDRLFIEDFGFDKSDPKLQRLMQYFVWIDNIMYCTFFKEPKFVLGFSGTPYGIKVQTISGIMALTWGLIMKREIK